MTFAGPKKQKPPAGSRQQGVSVRLTSSPLRRVGYDVDDYDYIDDGVGIDRRGSAHGGSHDRDCHAGGGAGGAGNGHGVVVAAEELVKPTIARPPGGWQGPGWRVDAQEGAGEGSRQGIPGSVGGDET